MTRGVAPRDHVMPAGIDADRLHDGQRDEAGRPPSSATRASPASRARDFRWERGDIKSTSLLGNVLARQMSADQRRDRDDHVPRPAILHRGVGVSNVWVVHEGALLGPPKSEHVLEGIRYELLRELCEESGIAFNLRPIPEADVARPTRCCSARPPRKSCR